MLLLNDAEHLNRALILELLSCFVPPGHVNTAAGSPRGEYVQNQFLPPELRDGARPSVLDGGERQRGERLADFETTRG